MTHIIIDGYNLIRQIPELVEIEAKSLESARQTLIQHLKVYRKYKSHKILLVFDGQSELSSFSQAYREGGIEICFSTGVETADDVIINAVKHNPQGTVVVTSDRFIMQEVRAQGCAILGSVEFYQKMKLALQLEGATSPEKQYDKVSQHKRWATYKKGPSKRLPKAKRRNTVRVKDL